MRTPKVKQEPEVIDLTEPELVEHESSPVQQPARSKGESGKKAQSEVMKSQTAIRKTNKKKAVQLKGLRVGKRVDEAFVAIRHRMRQRRGTSSVKQQEQQQQEENDKIRMLVEARKLDATRPLTLGGTRIQL